MVFLTQLLQEDLFEACFSTFSEFPWLKVYMRRYDSVPGPLPITFIVSADILYTIMQWLIRGISIGGGV